MMDWYKDAGFAQPWTFEETYVSDGYGGVKTDEFGSPIVDKPGDHVTEKTTTLYAKFTGATPITVNFKYYGPDNVSSAETKHTYSDVPVASNYPYGALPELPGNAKTEQVIIAGIPTMVTSYVVLARSVHIPIRVGNLRIRMGRSMILRQRQFFMTIFRKVRLHSTFTQNTTQPSQSSSIWMAAQ